MDYGRNQQGALVHAVDAVRGVCYVCPSCGLPLELRRGDNLEYFAHWRGLQGTRECELFVPGDGTSVATADDFQVLDTRVEDEPSELGLILDQLDDAWKLGLRLPEIPAHHLGDLSLADLRSAQVEVTAGGRVVARVSALDLRPGVGAARVPIPPALREYHTRGAGLWPQAIDPERWRLKSRGLEATGTLFRFRRGEWMRLSVGSGVHHDERLLVLADSRCPPPELMLRDVHAQFSSGGLQWTIWEVQIPSGAIVGDVAAWVKRSGHSLVRRPWSVTLVTPARTYGDRGEPVFWLGDSPLLALEAPMPGAEAIATLTTGSNSHSASVRAADDHSTHVLLESRSVGPIIFRVTADRSARLDCSFVERPSHAALLDLLANTLRLRVWIGDRSFEPWRSDRHTVRLGAHESPVVRVDLGGDDERARVTVWERGKQRSYEGLSARDVSTTVEAALATASLVEIDAGNLGRIELAPAVFATRAPDKNDGHDRLAWRHHVASMLAKPGEHTVPTVLERPRANAGLVPRSVDAAALVRARLALRRRRGTGDAVP